MKMIEVLVGISGSGKSTYAKTRWEADPNGVAIVNRDAIRNLLFGYTDDSIHDYYQRTDLSRREKEVTKIENTLIREALAESRVVIVDATHLKEKYLQRFTFWNVPIVYHFFNIPLALAVERANSRTRVVSPAVITKQLEQYLKLQKNGLPVTASPVELPLNPALPSCAIFDIDSTLSKNNGTRSPFDWYNVHKDTKDEKVGLLYNLMQDIVVIVCSGRDIVSKEKTVQWFKDNDLEAPTEWHFRPKGDVRPDWVVKEEMWRDIASRFNIQFLVDDRMQVVDRARSLGLKVFQVEYNNF